MKPKILMTGEEGFKNGLFHVLLSRENASAVAEAGGLPIVPNDFGAAEEYAAWADGLVLTGGKDLHASFYGGMYREYPVTIPYSTPRDLMELGLCRAFLAAKKPIFAFGRGLHVLNTVLGGNLKEAEGHRGEAVTELSFADAPHTVQVEKGSRLAAALTDGATVNSYHHLSADTLGEGLKAVAFAPDGTVEAVEHESLPVFAVQWHPEHETEAYKDGAALFRLFLSYCKEEEK